MNYCTVQSRCGQRESYPTYIEIVLLTYYGSRHTHRTCVDVIDLEVLASNQEEIQFIKNDDKRG